MSNNKMKEAKALLAKYGIKKIKPVQLTLAAAQLNKSLIETLKLIAHLKTNANTYHPFPHTHEALRGRNA